MHDAVLVTIMYTVTAYHIRMMPHQSTPEVLPW